MKIIVTGSLGHISKPLTITLIKEGHTVVVISSDGAKQKSIEALGAVAAIGSLEDVEFLAATFMGADAVYCMVPPNNYFDHSLNLLEYYRRLGRHYATAIQRSGVKKVVNLSTIGAHLEKGSGILSGAHDVQNILNELPGEISIVHMRPTAFYYNLFAYIEMIKAAGFIAANYGGDDMVPWVSPIDIAAAVAEELTLNFTGRKIRYVASQEASCSHTAKVLGAAIGKPDLQWKLISNEEMLNSLTGAGMNQEIAQGLVEMYGSLHTGLLAEDYYRNRPAIMGNIKLEDFAVDFATVFNQK
ncbi:MAG: NAD(P)H-binding protein [Rhizobacter sp.]|nr:NAD(P)H-binding protein [Ferruginibacter sp.]